MHRPSKSRRARSISLKAGASGLAFALCAGGAWAQAGSADQADTQTDESESQRALDTIVVKGIRGSLASAREQKRQADNLIEVINAEDVGKLPDQNLAEVLENITGVQLDRVNGVGTTVQIRGSANNRILINGVPTLPSNGSRTGINFQDIPATLIRSLEVIKVPEASTIEGSVGGTINLKTYRGLDIDDYIASFRADGEYSDLTESVNPRLSGTVGKRFDTGIGPIGVALTASYVQQDVASFNPRLDRDRVNFSGSSASSEDFDFLRLQFLQQVVAEDQFETFSFTGSTEWEPTDNLKLFVDVTYTDQDEVGQNAQAFLSGTGAGPAIANTTNTSFETVDLGSVPGEFGTLDLGTIMAVESGFIEPAGGGSINPNFRTQSNVGSRLTETLVLAGGFGWKQDRLSIGAQGQFSRSDTESPNLTATLDFINPNAPPPPNPDGGAGAVDNGTPGIFDASGRTLQFGIPTDLPTSPTVEQLLDPANYEFRVLQQALGLSENEDVAFQIDTSYDTDGIFPIFTSFDAGFRWNDRTFDASSDTTGFAAGGFANFFAGDGLPRPGGINPGIAALLVPGPDNFGDADGRDLFFENFLIVNPVVSFNDPDAVISAVDAAIPGSGFADGFELLQGNIIDTEETVLAGYVQGNYDTGVFGVPVRGNIGVRIVNTETTTANFFTINGEEVTDIATVDTTFVLPRWNLVAEPTDDIIIRGGIARDLRRPDLVDLGGINFPGNAAASVTGGNPALLPESVWSFDIGAEYYFSDTGFFSIGFFHKIRDDRIIDFTDATAVDPFTDFRAIEPPCDGGVFNPIANRGIFSDVPGVGICADLVGPINTVGNSTQTGVEIAFQYDLGNFEDQLGWASGFGFIGNLTWQDLDPAPAFFVSDSDGGPALNNSLGRTDGDGSTPTLDDDIITFAIGLEGLSDLSFNTTLYYEKYGLSARVRYTWRSDFVSDVVGGVTGFGLPRIIDDRGQLNANMSYQVTDWMALAVEGINLLREDRTEFCFSDEGLLCDQGLTDRRIVFGARFNF